MLNLASTDIINYGVYIIQTRKKELYLIIDDVQNKHLKELDLEDIEEACKKYQIKAMACGIDNKWKTKTSECWSSAKIALLRIKNNLLENLHNLNTDIIKHIADEEDLTFHQYRRFHNYVVSLINGGKLNNEDLANLNGLAKQFKETDEEDRW